MLAIFSLLGVVDCARRTVVHQETSVHWAGGQITFERARVTFHSMVVHRWSSGRTARASPARDSDVSRRSRQGILSR